MSNDSEVPARRLKLKTATKAAAKPKPKAEVNTDASGRVCTVLQGRHREWLQAVARMEGRTESSMLERLVRIAYSQDHGRARSTGATQVRAAGATGDGVSGQHPARGSE